MNRRGFLTALLSAGVVASAASAGVPIPQPRPQPAPAPTNTGTYSERYRTYRFTSTPMWFDLIAYTGIGGALQLRNVLATDAVVIVRCRSKISPWFVLDAPQAQTSIALPAHLNEAGHQYIAYELSRELIERENLWDDINRLRAQSPVCQQ